MNKKTKAHCNKCLGDRNHEILFTETTYWSHGESDPSGSNKYEMLKCQGCDSITLRHTSEWSEDPEPSVYYYPPAIFRRQPHWLYDLLGTEGALVRKLLNEIYGGLQNDMKMIATMGVRALMEHVMINSVGDQGTFAKNLTEFAKKGFISDKQRDILTVVLEIGHATMHRAYEPSDKDLTTCIDIAETVIQSIYVHPGKAAELAKRVPKRKP
jgi:hypothetical protein